MQDRLYTLKEHVLNALSLAKFTERGKRHFLIVTGGILSVIGIFTGWLVFLWFGIFLVYGVWLHFWITWDRGNPCPGPRHVFSSPTGQVTIGVCQGCNSWALTIRGEEVGGGTGIKNFIKRIRELQLSWERNVPEVAGELRALGDALEEGGHKSLLSKDFPAEDVMQKLADDHARAMGMDPQKVPTAEEQMAEIQEGMQKLFAEGPPVLVPANEYAEYAEWKQRQEAESGSASSPS